MREVGSEKGKSSPGAASESRLIIRASDLLLVTFKRLLTAGGVFFGGGALQMKDDGFKRNIINHKDYDSQKLKD